MPLTGELSDLSLAELIEFFCNQRKTGCLKVSYSIGAGYFYLKAGAVIHARLGDLRGIDAVYYALTQPNASFTFSPAIDAPEHTINQPWTSVVLEGLRRMDEGVTSAGPSPHSFEEKKDVVRQSPAPAVSMTKPAPRAAKAAAAATAKDDVRAFGALLSSSDSESFARRRWRPTMVLAAVIALIAIVGVPWGWYKHKNRAISMSDASAAIPPVPAVPAPQTSDTPSNAQPETVQAQAEPSPATDESEVAKKQREARSRERAKAAEQVAAAKAATSTASNKRATVTVTYDENGRVTAASGGDATALRIARQKRFPPGKPGSATITIPIN